MNPFLLYFVLIADNLIGLAIAVIVVSVIWLGAMGVTWLDLQDGYTGDARKALDGGVKLFKKFLLIPFIISILGLAFVPSTEKLAAGVVVYSVTNNEEVQKLPENLLKVLNLKLEDIQNDIVEGE